MYIVLFGYFSPSTIQYIGIDHPIHYLLILLSGFKVIFMMFSCNKKMIITLIFTLSIFYCFDYLSIIVFVQYVLISS
jgi:hypothetical protein